MADKLTHQQAQAVQDRGGKLLVSAAAGSGKTKVLVDRLLSYLTDPDDPANLNDFLIITYTKAAAAELRGKIAQKLTERIAQDPENKHLQKQMQLLFLTKISTVHGFCADIIREYAYRLNIAPDFRVADENECRELRDMVLDELLNKAYEDSDHNADFRAFVDTQGLGRTDKLVPFLVERVYDSAMCHMDPDMWLQKCLSDSDVDGVTDASDTVWGRYLLEDLFQYLDSQIFNMEACIRMAQECTGFEKPLLNFQDTVIQLRKLRACKTWDDVHRNRNIDYGRLTFPRKNPDPDLSDRMKAVRSSCKSGLEKKMKSFADDSCRVLSDLSESASSCRGLIHMVKQFRDAFRQAKHSRRVLDFADLEHCTLDLLLGKSRSGPTSAAAEIGNRFREIMVDEYQDSNGVQDAIFSALTERRKNCFMVGDVKQSIYQFRLADPGIFLNKYESYVSAEAARPGQGRKILLSHNFRSGPEVIDCVNTVFQNCMSRRVGGLDYGEEEALREGVSHASLPDPGIEFYAVDVQEDSYAEEAAFVAQKIHAMLENEIPIRDGSSFRGIKPEDIVILLRSPGSIGRYYQSALENIGIRCSTGAGMDLLHTEEIGTLRAFLQVIQNPRQDIPLISILLSPILGFTADDLASIRANKKHVSFFDALIESKHPKSIRFLETLEALRQEARLSTITQLLEKCFIRTRMDSIYAAMAGGEAKQRNLQTFYQLAADFESSAPRDLGQFMDHLNALEGKGVLTSETSAAGAVTIMSIHKSKGLEFPVVFLCGLSRSFNRDSLKAQILCDKDLGLGISIADRKNRVRYPSISKRAIMVKIASESLSEEMRVLYVAMTRARDRLIMTYASETLSKELQDIALLMDFDNGRLITQSASSPGKWILMSAMKRTEAGELHALGGRPGETSVSEMPWMIRVVQADREKPLTSVTEIDADVMPEKQYEQVKNTLGYVYPYETATMTPSKQTATSRKGRIKDAEAAEYAKEPPHTIRSWRRPSFLSQETDGRIYGNALHLAMQYICYEKCESLQGVNQEVQRMVAQGFLKPEQGALVDCKKIAEFFASPIGKKLIAGSSHLREFKFSILDKGTHYGENLDGEYVLLQGVVDCALMEEDGITIVDFKTDQVSEKNLETLILRYKDQVQTYGDALSRIFEQPVKAMYLYFFRINQFVKL